MTSLPRERVKEFVTIVNKPFLKNKYDVGMGCQKIVLNFMTSFINDPPMQDEKFLRRTCNEQ